jgi:hypothetical protein
MCVYMLAPQVDLEHNYFQFFRENGANIGEYECVSCEPRSHSPFMPVYIYAYMYVTCVCACSLAKLGQHESLRLAVQPLLRRIRLLLVL